MLASIPEFREVDFSHLQLADTNPGSVEPVRKQQSRFLWVALVFSLLLHLSLLFFNSVPNHPHQQIANQTLHIRLQQAPPTLREVMPDLVEKKIVEPLSAPEVVQEVASAPVAEVPVPNEKLPDARPATRLTIEPLSAQELAEITHTHSTTTTDQNSAAIADNVFHPGLRARLSAEASKPRRMRVEDSSLQTFTDPAGATVVKLPGGGCMRSPADTKIGAPKNWYFAACGGQSESEQMMERVNEDMNGTLRFDE